MSRLSLSPRRYPFGWVLLRLRQCALTWVNSNNQPFGRSVDDSERRPARARANHHSTIFVAPARRLSDAAIVRSAHEDPGRAVGIELEPFPRPSRQRQFAAPRTIHGPLRRVLLEGVHPPCREQPILHSALSLLAARGWLLAVRGWPFRKRRFGNSQQRTASRESTPARCARYRATCACAAPAAS